MQTEAFLPKCCVGLLWTMLPPCAWAIKYSVSHISLFVKPLEEVIQQEDGEIRRATLLL